MGLEDKCIFQNIKTNCQYCAGYDTGCTNYVTGKDRPRFYNFGYDDKAVMQLKGKLYVRSEKGGDYRELPKKEKES